MEQRFQQEERPVIVIDYINPSTRCLFFLVTPKSSTLHVRKSSEKISTLQCYDRVSGDETTWQGPHPPGHSPNIPIGIAWAQDSRCFQVKESICDSAALRRVTKLVLV